MGNAPSGTAFISVAVGTSTIRTPSPYKKNDKEFTSFCSEQDHFRMCQTINNRLNSDPQLITILQSHNLPVLFLFIFSLCVSFFCGFFLTVFGAVADANSTSASLFPIGLVCLCLGLPLSICLVVKYSIKISASKKLAVGTAIELTTTIFYELQQMFPLCEFECVDIKREAGMFNVQVTRRTSQPPPAYDAATIPPLAVAQIDIGATATAVPLPVQFVDDSIKLKYDEVFP